MLLKFVSCHHLLIGCLTLISSLTAIRLLFLNLLDAIVWEEFLIPNVLSDEERCTIGRILCRLLLGFWAGEAHLQVTRWREYVLGLRFSGQLLGEDLTFDVGVWTDVRNG